MYTECLLYLELTGSAKVNDINSSLRLVGKAALGVFIVMMLIFLVVVILNKIGNPHRK